MEEIEVRKAQVIPIKDMIILVPEKLEGRKIHLPSEDKGVSSGFAFLLAEKVGPDVKEVKEGDYVIVKAVAPSLAEFTILDVKKAMIAEEDVAIVLRKNN